MYRRAGVLVAGALALVAVAATIGWLVLSRVGTPQSGAAGDNASPGTTVQPASAGSANGAASSVTPSADDWMRQYRGMTFDQAFEAVATRVRFEPYVGVQRGARGTALARSGNAIDQALLLAEILRAGGYEVRFVHGVLSPENAAALLRGLYPPKVASAVFDAEYLPYQVAADEHLAALVRDHYWLEVNQGTTWLPLDPSFPRAKIGEAYGTAGDRFAEPPADLYQRVEFAWNIATAQRPMQQVARWNGTVADLGLQPISLVVDAIPGSPGRPTPDQPSSGGFLGGALTGAPAPKATSAQPATAQSPSGVRYVRSIETDTRRPATGNVSLESQPGSAVQKEWIEITLTGPGGLNRTIERTMYESEREAPSSQAEHRRYTILVVPGPVFQSFADEEIGRLRGVMKLDEWQAATARLQAEARSETAAKAAVEKAGAIEAAAGRTAGYLMTLEFAAASDALTDRIAYPNQIAVVRPVPRILIASSETRGNQADKVTSALSLDLRLDEVQAYPYPGFPARSVSLFQAGRGMQESVLEGQLVARWTGHETASTAALMSEASRNSVQLLTVDSEDRTELEQARGMTPRARSEIEAAITAGHEVIVPAEPVVVAGRPRWGWWDVDPASGAVVGVMEGGQHQAMTEYKLTSEKIGLNDNTAFVLGCIVGANSTMFLVCGKLLETGTVTPELIAAVEAYVNNGGCNSMCPPAAEASAGAKVKFGECYKIDGFKGVKAAIGAKAVLKFCAKYNEGFKCAGSLILAGLKGERPGVELTAEAKVTLPCSSGR